MMRHREREMWRDLVQSMETRMETMRQEAYTERRELLSRIQHPERLPVPVVDPILHDLPKDTAELAYVGGEVPPGVDVGHQPSGRELEWIGGEVPVGARAAVADEAAKINGDTDA